MQRFAPHAVVFSGVGFFACIGYFAYLAHVIPTHPDQIAGLTARMDDHGYYFLSRPGKDGCSTWARSRASGVFRRFGHRAPSWVGYDGRRRASRAEVALFHRTGCRHGLRIFCFYWLA